MVKADGCVAIHADGGAYKPLNWMNAPNKLVEVTDGDPVQWVVTNPKNETLTITLHEVLSDSALRARRRSRACRRTASRPTSRNCSPASPQAIEDGLTLVRREYPTAIGPIDLVCRDPDGTVVAVEVKRRGEIDGVEQLARYIERLAARLVARRGPRRVRRPVDQAPGQGARREPRLPLGRGRLRPVARHGPRRAPAVLSPARTAGAGVWLASGGDRGAGRPLR